MRLANGGGAPPLGPGVRGAAAPLRPAQGATPGPLDSRRLRACARSHPGTASLLTGPCGFRDEIDGEPATAMVAGDALVTKIRDRAPARLAWTASLQTGPCGFVMGKPKNHCCTTLKLQLAPSGDSRSWESVGNRLGRLAWSRMTCSALSGCPNSAAIWRTLPP